MDISEVIQKWSQECSPEGMTLDMNERIFRYELVEMCFNSDVAMAKLREMLPYIQKWARRNAGNIRNLFDMVTPIHMKKVSEIDLFLVGCFSEYGLICDGTPSFAEAEAIILTVVTTTWAMVDILIRVRFMDGSSSGDDTVLMIKESVEERGRRLRDLRPVMADRASANKKAIRCGCEARTWGSGWAGRARPLPRRALPLPRTRTRLCCRTPPACL